MEDPWFYAPDFLQCFSHVVESRKGLLFFPASIPQINPQINPDCNKMENPIAVSSKFLIRVFFLACWHVRAAYVATKADLKARKYMHEFCRHYQCSLSFVLIRNPKKWTVRILTFPQIWSWKLWEIRFINCFGVPVDTANKFKEQWKIHRYILSDGNFYAVWLWIMGDLNQSNKCCLGMLATSNPGCVTIAWLPLEREPTHPCMDETIPKQRHGEWPAWIMKHTWIMRLEIIRPISKFQGLGLRLWCTTGSTISIWVAVGTSLPLALSFW